MTPENSISQEQVQKKSFADPTTCSHISQTELVRTIGANGKSFIWLACLACGANLNGVGVFLPHQGIAVEALRIVQNYASTLCEVCGKLGAERHHWAPREVFGTEAESWPVGMLCPGCHTRWHQVMRLGK